MIRLAVVVFENINMSRVNVTSSMFLSLLVVVSKRHRKIKNIIAKWTATFNLFSYNYMTFDGPDVINADFTL